MAEKIMFVAARNGAATDPSANAEMETISYGKILALLLQFMRDNAKTNSGFLDVLKDMIAARFAFGIMSAEATKNSQLSKSTGEIVGAALGLVAAGIAVYYGGVAMKECYNEYKALSAIKDMPGAVDTPNMAGVAGDADVAATRTSAEAYNKDLLSSEQITDRACPPGESVELLEVETVAEEEVVAAAGATVAPDAAGATAAAGVDAATGAVAPAAAPTAEEQAAAAWAAATDEGAPTTRAQAALERITKRTEGITSQVSDVNQEPAKTPRNVDREREDVKTKYKELIGSPQTVAQFYNFVGQGTQVAATGWGSMISANQAALGSVAKTLENTVETTEGPNNNQSQKGSSNQDARGQVINAVIDTEKTLASMR